MDSAQQQPQDRTAPVELPDRSTRHETFLQAAQLEVGPAEAYWRELRAYPPGSPDALWFLVNGTWRHLDDPDFGMQDSVQEAFCICPDRLEVLVWCLGDVIVGLVVHSR